MDKLKLSILTNMVAPYRVPLFQQLAQDDRVERLRILTCTAREVDRDWDVIPPEEYDQTVLHGVTLNLKKGADGRRILHLRFGIFWDMLRHRPDRLIIGDASWTSYLAALACRALRIRYLVWNEITTSSQVSQRMAARLRRWMYRGADHLIASCGMAQDYLLENGVTNARISIALNAVDTAYFQSAQQRLAPERAKLRSQMGIAPDTLCLIFVGQLISRKCFVETLAWAASLASHQTVQVLVAGKGPLESQGRDLAKRLSLPIRFCGFCPPDELSALYTAADALVLFSQDEPWAMVVNEAALFGLHIFASPDVAAAVELQKIAPERVTITDVDAKPKPVHLASRKPVVLASEQQMAEAFLNAIV